MAKQTTDIVGNRLRGKHRIGVRGLEATLSMESDSLRDVVVDEITPAVDRRRITEEGGVIGSITFDDDTGEVVSWCVEDQFLKDTK